MIEQILTPINHREIEYNAKRLSGCNLPDSLLYQSDAAKALFDWISQTGSRVFDDDLVMDYGTDCLRLYLFFENTPKENDAPFYESWNEGALEGMYKFLGRYRRMILAASAWNRQGGYRMISKESVKTMQSALEQAQEKIGKCIGRKNTMSNRHNIVAALMELLNLLQKELKIGDIVTAVRSHAVDTAVPRTDRNLNGAVDRVMDEAMDSKSENEEVTQICKDFVLLMAPIVCDMSKMLWLELG